MQDNGAQPDIHRGGHVKLKRDRGGRIKLKREVHRGGRKRNRVTGGRSLQRSCILPSNERCNYYR